MEYINISGLRLDGRRPHEVRRVRSQLGLFPRADGSALLEMGHTKVMAVVHGPRESTHRSGSEHDAAVLECDVRFVAICVRLFRRVSWWQHCFRIAVVPRLQSSH